MITFKPFHKPTGPGRFDLLLTVTVEFNGKKLTSNYAPPTARSLTTPDQATTVFFSDAYQLGLARFVRNMTAGWRVGAPSSGAAPARPAPAVHQVAKPLRPPAANDMIENLYSGSPRVQVTPPPQEARGRIVTKSDGSMAERFDTKPTGTVETVEELRVVNGKTVDLKTTDGLMASWQTRPQPNRRVRDLATLLSVKTQNVIDTLLAEGDTSISSHMSVMTDAQARLVMKTILKR